MAAALGLEPAGRRELFEVVVELACGVQPGGFLQFGRGAGAAQHGAQQGEPHRVTQRGVGRGAGQPLQSPEHSVIPE